MKTAIFFAVLIGFATCAPQPEAINRKVSARHMSKNGDYNLAPAMGRILGQIDFETLILWFLEQDWASCEGSSLIEDLIAFLHSENFATIHFAVWTEPEFLAVMNFININGFPEIYDVINNIYYTFGLEFIVGPDGPIQTSISKTISKRSNIKACPTPEEIEAIISQTVKIDQILSVVLELINVDPGVQALMFLISEPAKYEAYRTIKAMPEVETFLNHYREQGIPIDMMLDLLETMLWGDLQSAIVSKTH